MQQEIGPNQEKWLQALENGEYKQGRKKLRTVVDTYCCLGVGCDIFSIPVRRCEMDYIYGGESHIAPDSLVDILALRDKVGSPKDLDLYRSLVSMNDHGATFKEIARRIRSHPCQYFTEPR